MFYIGTKQLEEKLYAEIRGRIKEDDMSVPLRKGNYYYYKRTLEGEEYVRHCRRVASDNGVQLSVHDTMPTGPDAPPEHVILDENVKSKQHAYYCVDALKVSLLLLASYLCAVDVSFGFQPQISGHHILCSYISRLVQTISW